MMVLCWVARGFEEVVMWITRVPEEIPYEFMRYFALLHVVGILAEIVTNALCAHFIGEYR